MHPVFRPGPHLGEVTRLVNRLRERLVGRQVKEITHNPELNIDNKTHLKRLTEQAGSKVLEVNQWGTYFWLEMKERSRHPVFNLGKSGWIEIWDGKIPDPWPPKNFHTCYKFSQDDPGERPLAFAMVDRALDNKTYPPCWRPTYKIVKKNHAPTLREAASFPKHVGMDPSRDTITEEWLKAIFQNQHNPLLPIRRCLEVPQFLQGLGDWVADEILYQARINPVYPSGMLSDDEIARLCKAIEEVAKVAVETEGDFDKMPEDWLVHYYEKQLDSTEPVVTKDGKTLATATIRTSRSVYVPEVQPLQIPEGLEMQEDGTLWNPEVAAKSKL